MLNRLKWLALMTMATSLATHKVAADPQCPNLSGNYTVQGEDGQVHIAIEQHACNRIHIVRKSGYLGAITTEKHMLNLDGNEQKDSPWFGGTEQYRSSARFEGSKLQIKAIGSRGSTFTVFYSLTPGRDLKEDAGTNGRNVAKRQN